MTVYKLIEASSHFDGRSFGGSVRVLVGPDGLIRAINPRDGELPSDLTFFKGEFLTPGLVDAHTHIGVHGEAEGWAGRDTNEYSEPLTPYLRALDSLNPWDRGFTDALEGGVTTVNVVPGSANPIGGQGVYLKVWRSGELITDELVILEPSCLKMATGENPKRVYQELKKSPQTRMAIAYMIRRALTEALNYKDKLAKGEAERDLGKEALLKVLKGEIPAHVHAHRADDIITAIRIAREFNIRIAIVHGTEGHKVANYLAGSGVPVMVGPSLTSRVKRELEEVSFRTPLELYRAGVKFSITSDAPVVPIKYMNLLASLAAREGLPSEEAMRAITSYPVEILSMTTAEMRRGVIRRGYAADLVLWNAHPLEWQATPQLVMVDGEVALQKPKPER